MNTPARRDVNHYKEAQLSRSDAPSSVSLLWDPNLWTTSRIDYISKQEIRSVERGICRIAKFTSQ